MPELCLVLRITACLAIKEFHAAFSGLSGPYGSDLVLQQKMFHRKLFFSPRSGVPWVLLGGDGGRNDPPDHVRRRAQ